MSEHIILTSDILVDQEVLSLVIEDDMDFLGTRATNIRSYEDEKVRTCDINSSTK